MLLKLFEFCLSWVDKNLGKVIMMSIKFQGFQCFYTGILFSHLCALNSCCSQQQYFPAAEHSSAALLPVNLTIFSQVKSLRVADALHQAKLFHSKQKPQAALEILRHVMRTSLHQPELYFPAFSEAFLVSSTSFYSQLLCSFS